MIYTRWNSLQNLNSSATRSRDQRKNNQRPVKMAWMSSKSPSEEKQFSYESWQNVTTAGLNMFDLYRKSQRKSIDIFLSSTLTSDESEETAANRRGKFRSQSTPTVSPFSGSEDTTTQQAAPVDATLILPIRENNHRSIFNENQSNRGSVSLEKHSRTEKKVTFALESAASKKLTAEARRLNFRNSYSKRSNKNLPSPASSSTSTTFDEVDYDCPVTTVETSNSDASCSVESGSFEVSPPVEINSITASFASPRLTKQVNGSIDKSKQIIKRKLKSCRSRSFHKSLDICESTSPTAPSFSCAKPLKGIHPEVVTMVSLVSSEEPTDYVIVETSSTNSEMITETNLSIPVTVNDATKLKSVDVSKGNKTDNEENRAAATQKSKLFSNSIPKALHLPKDKPSIRPTLSIKRKDLMGVQEPRTNWHSTGANVARVVQPYQDQTNQTSEYNCLSKYAALQCGKEKECWSSFYKMSDKGVFVSFDTILRGLLTPTEYRLRKNDLLTQ